MSTYRTHLAHKMRPSAAKCSSEQQCVANWQQKCSKVQRTANLQQAVPMSSNAMRCVAKCGNVQKHRDEKCVRKGEDESEEKKSRP
jgi:hypothetical protein